MVPLQIKKPQKIISAQEYGFEMIQHQFPQIEEIKQRLHGISIFLGIYKSEITEITGNRGFTMALPATF